MIAGSSGGIHVHPLGEFLLMTREKLDAFERYWREQVAAGDANFPTSLLLGDWEEQFDIFESDVSIRSQPHLSAENPPTDRGQRIDPLPEGSGYIVPRLHRGVSTTNPHEGGGFEPELIDEENRWP